MSEVDVIIIAERGQQPLLQPFLDSLPAPLARRCASRWVWLWDGAAEQDAAVRAMQAQVDAWCERCGLAPNSGVVHVSALDSALAATRAPWLVVCPLDLPQPGPTLEQVAAWTQTAVAPAVVLAVVAAAQPGLQTAAEALPATRLAQLPQRSLRALRRSALEAAVAPAAGACLRPGLAVDVLTWRLLLQPEAAVSLIAGPPPASAAGDPARRSASEPDVATWRDLSTYDAVLQHAFAQPLAEAAVRHGRAPTWLQLAALEHLHWYFTVDGRQRAPTVACDATLAPLFHDRMRQAMLHIDAETLVALAAGGEASTEVCHALWSYRAPTVQSDVSADAFDHAKGLLRLTWWVHGEPPAERIVVDGREVAPTYAKFRACKYFDRVLLRQRIVWVAAATAGQVQVRLGDAPLRAGIGAMAFTARSGLVAEGEPPADGELSAQQVRAAYPPNKGGQLPLPAGLAGWRVRLLKALARLPWIRRRYRDAWVFIDREEDADDSAEHLYRWVRANHPAINCWFMLLPHTADWARLQAEGFRLVAPGLLRKLMILNSRHIISSHTDYVFGGMDRRLYGDAMRWHYTFLQHGVIKDDLTHWLGPREFDRFITSSPHEHASIVGDDTCYPYTDREVRRTGLPRHDRLLRIANAMPPQEVRTLLVMPTWRASLVDERMAAQDPAERLAEFAASDYARHWRELLNNPVLAAAAANAGLRIAFMPHANAAPYLQAFDLPAHVDVVTSAGNGVQKAFAGSVALITDYTSVAFTMAFLRRQVFYYQFDRQSFYAGGHNWRAGYFEYERDGFGPVSTVESELVQELVKFVRAGCKTDPRYLERMESAMPDRDENACSRTFDSIIQLNNP